MRDGGCLQSHWANRSIECLSVQSGQPSQVHLHASACMKRGGLRLPCSAVQMTGSRASHSMKGERLPELYCSSNIGDLPSQDEEHLQGTLLCSGGAVVAHLLPPL